MIRIQYYVLDVTGVLIVEVLGLAGQAVGRIGIVRKGRVFDEENDESSRVDMARKDTAGDCRLTHNFLCFGRICTRMLQVFAAGLL